MRNFDLAQILLMILCVKRATLQTDNDCHATFQDSCYKVRSDTGTWKQAVDLCRADGGHLVTVTTPEENQVIADLVEENGFSGVWLGLKEKFVPWQWLNGQLVFEQGCYSSQFGNDVRGSSEDLINNGFGPCEEICRNSNFKFGALTNGKTCLCGNSFQSFIASEDCNIVCSGASFGPVTPTCGGQGANEIFVVNGLHSSWVSGQPNNIDGYQACAYFEIYRAENDTRVLGWTDTTCRSRLGVACEFSLDFCDTNLDSLTQDADNLLVQSNATSVCFLVMPRQLQSFFLARQTCKHLGGDLAILDTKEKSDFLHSFLQENLDNLFTNGYWIGLTRTFWNWVSGEEMVFTNWQLEGEGSPNGASQECIWMIADTWVWDDSSCEESVFNIICERDSSLDREATTTSDVTTAEEINFNTTTVLPDVLEDIDYAIIAGVASGLLLILILSLTFTCCIYRKLDKRMKEKRTDEQREPYFFGLDPSPSNNDKFKQDEDAVDVEASLQKDQVEVTDGHKEEEAEEEAVAELDTHISNLSIAQDSSGSVSDQQSSMSQVPELEVVGEKPDLLSDLS